MKNVLFATTALVAMTGSAMAASHGGMSPAVSFSGDVTGGYNDVIEGGLFLTGNIGVTANVDLGDNVTAKVTWGGFDIDLSPTLPATALTVSQKVTAEFVYTGSSYTASLLLGDMGDKGASEYFYKDRSGMALDVENQDNHNGARALVEFGSFGVAVGCGQPSGVDGTTPNAPLALGVCQGMNIGLGATFGSFKLGVGYDDAANLDKTNAASPRTAVSADATFGSFDLGISYITNNTDNSIGLTAGTTFGAAKVKAYYAMNSGVPADEFGVSVDYTSGAMTVGAYYENNGTSTYGLDLGYKVSDALTASAGVKASGATVYYAGIVYAVNSNITATVSYATADAIHGPEFKDGISAFITAKF